MKNIVKRPDEFDYGEFYYIRRKYKPYILEGDYSRIFTILDCSTLGAIRSEDRYKLSELKIDVPYFKEDIIDFERVQDEYIKFWIEKRFEYSGVYLDRINIETKRDILYLTDKNIKIGQPFLGYTDFSIIFQRQESFSEGVINSILKLGGSLKSDILCGYEYKRLGEDQKLYRSYKGANGIYNMAIPWDEKTYEEQILDPILNYDWDSQTVRR